MGTACPKHPVIREAEPEESGLFPRGSRTTSHSDDPMQSGEMGGIMSSFSANIGWLESVFSEEVQRPDVVEALHDIREACQRLVWLCKESSALSRHELPPLLRVEVPFSRVLQSALQPFRKLIETGSIVLGVDQVQDMSLRLDHDLSIRMLQRLIEAAVQAAAGSGSVLIECYSDTPDVTIRIVASRSVVDVCPASLTPLSSAIPPTVCSPSSHGVRFSAQLARAHGGNLRSYEDPEHVTWLLTLPLNPANDSMLPSDPEDFR